MVVVASLVLFSRGFVCVHENQQQKLTGNRRQPAHQEAYPRDEHAERGPDAISSVMTTGMASSEGRPQNKSLQAPRQRELGKRQAPAPPEEHGPPLPPRRERLLESAGMSHGMYEFPRRHHVLHDVIEEEECYFPCTSSSFDDYLPMSAL